MPETSVRVVFLGTADLAATVLEALLASPIYEVIGILSQPDRPQGRSLRVHPTPVKQVALAHRLPVLQPETVRNPDVIRQIQDWEPTVLVVAAYGQLLPSSLLQIAPFGCVNVHTSLLPRWRGAAPIQWAIDSGDPETGVSLMVLDAGMDTGPILSRICTPIESTDTGQSLHDRLASLGAAILVRDLIRYVHRELEPIAQPQMGSTHARKLTREDGLLDWNRSAESLERRIRAFWPWPGTFARARVGMERLRLKTHRARLQDSSSCLAPPGTILNIAPKGLFVQCSSGILELLEVQPEGSRRMAASQFLTGHPQVSFVMSDA